jgi:hypothetical protein
MIPFLRGGEGFDFIRVFFIKYSCIGKRGRLVQWLKIDAWI